MAYTGCTMDWVRMHPYHVAIASAVVLLLIGIFFIRDRSAISPLPTSNTVWGSSGTGLFAVFGSRAPQENGENLQDLYRNIQGGPPFTYIPYTPPEESEENTAFDFDAF